MLVFSRRRNESIIIDGRIEVKILYVDRDMVKIGIEAPRSVAVHRREVQERLWAEGMPRPESE